MLRSLPYPANWTARLTLALGLVVLIAPPAPAENPKIAPSRSVTVLERVSGAGVRQEFTVAAIRDLVAKGRLKEHDSGPVIIYGEHSGDQGVWHFKGVRALDLITLATGYEEKASHPLYAKRKGLYVAAYASDAYPAVLSWSELLFTPTGALALVAYEWALVKPAKGGGRAPFTGDLVLVVPTDTFAGAREVQALKSIEVRHVGDPAVK